MRLTPKPLIARHNLEPPVRGALLELKGSANILKGSVNSLEGSASFLESSAVHREGLSLGRFWRPNP